MNFRCQISAINLCILPYQEISASLFFADLLHITGIGHGTAGLGVGFQHTPPPEPEPRRTTTVSTMGSDILDSNSHEMKLEKSNILLLGPTGSGLCSKYEVL
jgi:hypothetical protein